VSLVFDNVLLNNEVDGGIIDYNAISGGPEASTTVVTNPFSGISQRNVNRLDRLRRYTVNTSLLRQQQLNNFREFWECRDAMARAFLMRDMADFWASRDGSPSTPIGTPMLFGTGDGALGNFGLYKTYSSGGVTRTRRIIKPVSGTVTIYKNDVAMTSGYSIDYATGIVSFGISPALNDTLKWTGRFYVPVRFESDAFSAEMADAITGLSYQGLEMLEVPPAEFDLDY
jgi:uncharacterized protein (TIGR02217 family)